MHSVHTKSLQYKTNAMCLAKKKETEKYKDPLLLYTFEYYKTSRLNVTRLQDNLHNSWRKERKEYIYRYNKKYCNVYKSVKKLLNGSKNLKVSKVHHAIHRHTLVWNVPEDFSTKICLLVFHFSLKSVFMSRQKWSHAKNYKILIAFQIYLKTLRGFKG